MEFFATEHFVYRYKLLLKKKKQYGCLETNFHSQFENIPDDELWNMGFQLFLNGSYRATKIRLKSCSGHGDSSGFRVIALVNEESKKFYFLDVYPKTGKYAQANFEKQELKEFLTERKEEEDAGILYQVKFNFNGDLVHMVQNSLVEK